VRHGVGTLGGLPAHRYPRLNAIDRHTRRPSPLQAGSPAPCPLVLGRLNYRDPDPRRVVLADVFALVILAGSIGAQHIATKDRQLSVNLADAMLALHVGVILFNVFGLVAVPLGG
jgi:hypothetical protein